MLPPPRFSISGAARRASATSEYALTSSALRKPVARGLDERRDRDRHARRTPRRARGNRARRSAHRSPRTTASICSSLVTSHGSTQRIGQRRPPARARSPRAARSDRSARGSRLRARPPGQSPRRSIACWRHRRRGRPCRRDGAVGHECRERISASACSCRRVGRPVAARRAVRPGRPWPCRRPATSGPGRKPFRRAGPLPPCHRLPERHARRASGAGAS